MQQLHAQEEAREWLELEAANQVAIATLLQEEEADRLSMAAATAVEQQWQQEQAAEERDALEAQRVLEERKKDAVILRSAQPWNFLGFPWIQQPALFYPWNPRHGRALDQQPALPSETSSNPRALVHYPVIAAPQASLIQAPHRQGLRGGVVAVHSPNPLGQHSRYV